MKNIKSYASLIVMSAVVAACGGGGGGGDDVAVNDVVCPTVGNLATVELGGNQCQISGTLTEDGTLSSSIDWFLEGRLQIGDETNTATLNIDAGTDIRGDNVGETDHVLVFPGSALSANGTSANPVQFLSDDDNVDGTAEWGGVFLRGFNGISLSGTQGANDLDYVVVAEAGAPVSVEIDGQTVNYSDNIVLNGVDSSTTLTFVQSHNSNRDGLHILNGDPRLSWILATGSQRDGIWYRDFNGLIKDLMVIHNPDAGRSGIYASRTGTGVSNPRIVNATLVGRDDASVDASADAAANEFGILFADNVDNIRLGNVLVANFRNGCYEADSGANLTAIDTSIPGPSYLDGVHCANEAGPNPSGFGVVRSGSTGFPAGTVAANNSINGDGLVYYNGAVNGVTFTGEIADRTENFTASWYLDNIGGIGNGLVGDSTFLNAFLDGDTNNDRVVDSADTNSPFIIADNAFNQDVADDTGGYDLTHIGAVRGGSPANDQFDGWTVATAQGEGFLVEINDALVGTSVCPINVGGAPVTALERSAGRNVCEVSGVMSSAGTLTSDIDWELEGRLQVGAIGSPATLTIASGTRISGDNVDAVDHLIVFPGSSIQANGSSARPIRFTSDDADINGSGEWGGVFLRGEDDTLTADDNLLDYVVVAEAGAQVDIEAIDGVPAVSYFDNIVLNRVDESTRLTFVQSHNSARDGIHIVNSQARLSWVLSTGSARDGIWYQDFNGLIKDLMVIHNPDSDASTGRSGIYASASNLAPNAGESNPRIVNATLVGRDDTSVDASADTAANEYGILFADNVTEIQLANVLIANFRNGCYEADSLADLSGIDAIVDLTDDAATRADSFVDGVHCANEAGANPNGFDVVRAGAIDFTLGVVGPNNENGDGIRYYNGAATTPIVTAPVNGGTPFTPAAGGINFTGEIAERADNFTAGWYLDNIRGIGNGLAANSLFLNGLLDGDTNNDGAVNGTDVGATPLFGTPGLNDFNEDVAGDTNGYDLTHVGAVRSGAVNQTNVQFDNWTVDTSRSAPFTVRTVPVSP